MNRFLLSIVAVGVALSAYSAQAFCGFYVAKGDTSLFNNASKVVIAKDGERTVITMSNDYEGSAKDFAMVIPVPVALEKEQVNVTENKIIDHLDAYTAPRLVEYFDPDPCQQMMYRAEMMTMADGAAPPRAMNKMRKSAKKLGVTIEDEYTVGEYDILILSAKQSDGLQTWLNQEGYKVPKKARDVLGSYIKQGNKFFVAKVNLKEHAKNGGTYLRPIAVAFNSDKFMLPIRLGTVNAKDSQELFIFTLTKKGRVETTNYRTTKIPTGDEIPTYMKEEFAKFYPAMFNTAVKKEGMKTVFMEYAWDMGWCDPCAANPLSTEELQQLGVSWLNQYEAVKPTARPGQPIPRRLMVMPRRGGAQNVFVTRMHVRYNAENFPEDLKFQETADRQNFQGRYVLRHPFKGDASCEAGTQYRKSLVERNEKEAKTLANLTGWDINKIRSQMKEKGVSFDVPKDAPNSAKWWKKLWEK